ncbi:hypothetical protein POM88_002474 [Heracleum sosnowskyi]|uniref:Replication protein A 70 kDa DNA-binding subunit B/D first OB fold domain-containing protein n=1 Tax=Heracleum sosnowskyi TaxID=360622 RepID=A0AAD8JG64_9APIA|nr:hypothetical protein POM88_002474 [Heracleum sosnowskyi]
MLSKKCFNVMLIDIKKTRIHAFIPTTCAEQNEKKLKIGYVCNITNFTVQPYKLEEKFRCLRNDKQLIFSKDTIIEQIDNRILQIPQDDFDFYDHSELMALTKQTTYLVDVVGIIKTKFKGVNKVYNRLGKDQCQAKFTITDGKGGGHRKRRSNKILPQLQPSQCCPHEETVKKTRVPETNLCKTGKEDSRSDNY